MKKIVTALAIFASSIAFSQVGIGTNSPHSSSILDLTATDKAMLLPRVANTAAIPSPINGMMIYDKATRSSRILFYAVREERVNKSLRANFIIHAQQR